MRIVKLTGEAMRVARSQPTTSIVTGLIVAAVCGVILSTTGQTVQAEREVLAQIDEAGTRSIVFSDVNGTANIQPAAVDRISRLSGVEWVVGLGPASDVRSAGVPGGAPVAARTFYGDLPSAISTSGWDRAPGTALVGPEAQRTLGFRVPAGEAVYLDGSAALAVVGWFQTTDPLDSLNTSLLTAPNPDRPSVTLRTIHILVTSPDQVVGVADAAASVLDPEDPTSVGVETSAALAEIRSAVSGELGRFGRQLVSLILGAGLVLVALTLYGSVTGRRRDFGRRRALGSSRQTIVFLVCCQTFIVALIGAAAGTLIGAALIWRWTGSPPDAPFTVAIATLAIIAATIAAIPPALVAAHRDPVRVLRVP